MISQLFKHKKNCLFTEYLRLPTNCLNCIFQIFRYMMICIFLNNITSEYRMQVLIKINQTNFDQL